METVKETLENVGEENICSFVASAVSTEGL